MKPGRGTVRVLWTLTLLLSAIGVAAVVRRISHLAVPPAGPPAMVELDAGFARYPLLTLFHILPGLLFVVLGPLQFVQRLRQRRPALHRAVGRVVLISGMVAGITALVMSPRMAIGGINETAATMLFATVFLFSLGKAFAAIRRGMVALHREWMIRAFALGLAVALVRPIVGVFFATRRLTGLTPHEFFGTAFWLGFSIQAIAAEIWVNRSRPRPEAIPPVRSTPGPRPRPGLRRV